jgi:hypothetical protein
VLTGILTKGLNDDSTDYEKELEEKPFFQDVVDVESRCTDVFTAAADSYARFLSLVSVMYLTI